MIWIIGAIALGIILGVIGYYFSNTAFTIFVTLILVVFSFLITFDYELYWHYRDMAIDNPSRNHKYLLLYFNEVFKLLSPHHLMVALSFTFSFFGARIMTWLLTSLGFVSKIAVQEGDYIEGTMQAYDYLEGVNDRTYYYWYY